jgi:hypothetical protein
MENQFLSCFSEIYFADEIRWVKIQNKISEFDVKRNVKPAFRYINPAFRYNFNFFDDKCFKFVSTE